MDSDGSFIYMGQSSRSIPRPVARVRVDPAVKVIGKEAFAGCEQLINVELCEGLERIDEQAFIGCKSLTSITIPSTVKVIGQHAFRDCFELRNVKLNEGLEEIGHGAFTHCTSLTSIRIPSTVKEIGSHAFRGCTQLRNVELNEGLEIISCATFQRCTSLRRIKIPATVTFIQKYAFHECSALLEFEFCKEMEQLLNEASLSLWNHDSSKASLRTYSFLAQHNIPSRLGTIKVRVWRDIIHNMLRQIPERFHYKPDYEERIDNFFEEVQNVYFELYFHSIVSRLANYEHLQDIAPFLELALWKANITEYSDGDISNVEDDVKLMCRINSLSMFPIIFPNVFSFLSVDE